MKNARLFVIAIAFVLVSFPVISNAGSWNGWIYQNPYPTSNNLFDVTFITPLKGWITGKYGTILCTEDGGENWEAQESRIEEDIMRVAFVNKKMGWAAARNGTIIHTQDGGKKWVKQYNIKALPTKIFFINEKEGWITGANPRGVVYHTRNSSKTWRKMKTGISRAISSVYFNNSQTGWILAGEDVYRTTDGGKTWKKSKLPVKMPSMGGFPGRRPMPGTFGITPVKGLGPDWWFGGIAFANEKQGWAAVSRGIFYTEDGGKTWTTQFDTGSLDRGLRHISFRDAKNGCATGWSIHCTKDGGKTWKERLGLGPGNDEGLGGISLTGKSAGWIVGNAGQILKTNDRGRKWNVVTEWNECGPTHFFINKKKGWFYSPLRFNVLCKTDDGGLTMGKKDIGIKVKNVFFEDDSTGWAVGVIEEWKDGKENAGSYNRINVWGVIKSTADGGKTWQTQYKESMGKDGNPNLTGVYFISRATGWVIGTKGIILHTVDGGKHWTYQKSGDAKNYLRRVYFNNSQEGWITGYQFKDHWTGMILNTEDGGKHWKLNHKQGNVAFIDLHFTDNKSGWVSGNTDAGEVGILLSTEDGGKTWSKKAFKNIGYNYMAFLDDERGVIYSLETGLMVISINGGKTWGKMRTPLKKYPWHFSELFEKGKSMTGKNH